MNIKEKIIAKVNSINNTETLTRILSLITSEVATEDIYQFSDEEKERVQQGILDADTGNIYTQEASENIISKWLEEKSNGLLEH